MLDKNLRILSVWQRGFKPKSRSAAAAIEYGLLAGGIFLAIFVGVSATGTGLRNLFQDFAGSITQAQQTSPPNDCAADEASQAGIVYFTSGNGGAWSFPTYACGTGGIAGPVGPVQTVNAGGGDYSLVQVNSQGVQSYYAVLQGNRTQAAGGSTTLFSDGYATMSADAAYFGITYASFSQSCTAGYTSQPSGYGPSIVYNPSTPSEDSAGNFLCGGSSIKSGSLATYW